MDRKKGWKDLSYKEKVSYILCIASFVTGAVLCFTGMLVVPLGEISASVLTGTGLFLTFCGSIIGIHMAYKQKFEDFAMEIGEKLNKNTDNQ